MDAWGPFTNWSVDLSQGSEGLHLVYGPNEAGKSAALRGLKALLFGIDERSTDNFLHDYKKMRISATLRAPDGRILELVRRKGRAKTLLTPGGEVLDEAVLRELLAGVGADAFSRMFGLDHQELTAGGKEIVSGKGDVGQSLFVAALGGHSMRQILGPLEEEAAGLYAPRAAKRTVNLWLEEYHQATKEAKESSLPGREWEEHTRRFQEAHERKKVLQQEIGRMEAELRRLERIRSALPSIALRKELQRKRKEMGPVLILPAGFAEMRRRTLGMLNDAREKRAKAQKKLEQLQHQIEQRVAPAALLGEADAVSGLYKLLGSYNKMMEDLPKRKGEAAQLEADAAAILKDIRPGAALEEADALQIGLAARNVIRDLGASYPVIVQNRRTAEETRRKLEARIAQARNTLQEAPQPCESGTLKELLKRARKFGDLEAEAARLQSTLDAEIRQSEIELARLPLWAGSLEQLEAAAVPEEETIAQFEKAFAETDQKRRELETKRAERIARQFEVEGMFEALQLTSPVPTEETLTQARERRNKGWKLIRAAWLQGEAPHPEVEAFCGGVPLEEVYEKTVLEADEVADRLRREADRVAQHASLVAERDRTAREILALSRDLEELAETRSALQNRWREAWRGAAVEPLSPLEMRSWTQRQRLLAQRSEKIRSLRRDAEALQQQISKLIDEISAQLEGTGECLPGPADGLNALIEQGQMVADRIDRANAERQRLESSIAEASAEMAEALRRAEEAEVHLRDWQERWTKAVAEIGLDGSASVETAHRLVDRLQELGSKTEELAAMRRRVESMERDAASFAQRARALAERIAQDLAGLPAEAIASKLYERLAKAREDEAARQQLLRQRGDQERELAEAADAIARADQDLAGMCAQAKCPAVEGLEEAERRSEQAAGTDAELKAVERELLAFAGGGTVEELVRDAQEVDPDSLPGRIELLQDRLASSAEELSEVNQIIGSEKAELDRMDGSPRAAEAAQRAQSALAQLRDGIERYARLRLACLVMNREMERYRAKNQGPVLTRASEIFSTLTLGSFAGLATDVEDDRPVLKGIRRSGEQVGVEGMSDGTCDQLYLSLRLAGLEKHIEEQEPLPFIIDDILVNFDDHRAEATFRVLADFSRKTQVVFFTHHAHLIPLAQAALPPGILWIHPMSV